MRCGEPADVAYIAEIPDEPLGPPRPRWLDLCARCAYWLRTTMPDDLEPRDITP